MLYFAYGSNMNPCRMTNRCSSAQFVTTAKLEEFQLCFPRKSKTGSGVASVEPKKGEVVWGVVYHIDELHLGFLDKAEGCNPNDSKSNSYNRKEIQVLSRGAKENPLTVFTYLAVAEPKPPLPTDDYKAHIVKGAKYWDLPKDYIEKLKKIPTAAAL